MDAEDLHDRYEHLRRQLDAAYAAPVWDSEHIDRIADQMIPVETALAGVVASRDAGREAADV
ncbi:MAG: hypothetical protein M3Z29_12830 [Pseudomonadota bacterium]|nr:hypothetical protein [Pseudomonadota bacterium]